MLFAKFLAMIIMFIPALIVATVCRTIVVALLAPLIDIGSWSTFEIAIATLIPYMILVYCALINPVVNFWQSLQGRNMPQGGGQNE